MRCMPRWVCIRSLLSTILMTISDRLMPRCKMRIRSWLPSVRSASISIVKIRSRSQQTIPMRSSGWQSATISPVILHSRRTHDKLAMHLKRIDVIAQGRGPWFRWKPSAGSVF